MRIFKDAAYSAHINRFASEVLPRLYADLPEKLS
jgi:hypothetical protein